MAYWNVYLVREIVERARARAHQQQRRDGFALPTMFAEEEVYAVSADTLSVEGGALVFYRDGEINLVLGPNTYERVVRHEGP